MAKYSKEEVNYSRGMINSHCGKVFSNDTGYCKHFQGPTGALTQGTCALVNGSISPVYWCKEFEKAKK